MNEYYLIKELMNEYFYNIEDKDPIEMYNYLFDSVDGNHEGIADQLERKEDLKYSDIANRISNTLTERTENHNESFLPTLKP